MEAPGPGCDSAAALDPVDLRQNVGAPLQDAVAAITSTMMNAASFGFGLRSMWR